MKKLLYRVSVADTEALKSALLGLAWVSSVDSRSRGQIILCADSVTADQLSAVDVVVKMAATEVLSGRGPGAASDVLPENDRTANVGAPLAAGRR